MAAISGDLAEADLGLLAAPAMKKIGLKLGGTSNAGSKAKSASNLMDAGVFGGNDDSTTAKSRTIIPLDYTGIPVHTYWILLCI